MMIFALIEEKKFISTGTQTYMKIAEGISGMPARNHDPN